MNSIIQIEDLSIKLNEAVILEDISVCFEAEKIHGIIGRNGSGKTVLLKCICGLIPASNGSIVVNGKHVENGKVVPGQLGAIIETPGFLSQYSGLRNLKMLASLSGRATTPDVYNSMKLVGLGPHDKKPVGKYSLGMRQRLGIAQAIMEHPKLLILDEPMNGLDAQGLEDIRKLLLTLRDEGTTILLASHNTEDIDTLCDTVCRIQDRHLIKVSGWEVDSEILQ